MLSMPEPNIIIVGFIVVAAMAFFMLSVRLIPLIWPL
jgi:hypothetical protein